MTRLLPVHQDIGRHGLDLNQKGQQIVEDPLLIGAAEERVSRKSDLVAGASGSGELAAMGAGRPHANCHPVVLGDDVVNRDMEIRHGAPEALNHRGQRGRVTDVAQAGSGVDDEPRRPWSDQLVGLLGVDRLDPLLPVRIARRPNHRSTLSLDNDAKLVTQQYSVIMALEIVDEKYPLSEEPKGPLPDRVSFIRGIEIGCARPRRTFHHPDVG
jgi:hypothetical protein